MIDVIESVSQESEMPRKELFSDSLLKNEGEVSFTLHLDRRKAACHCFFAQS